MMTIKRINPQPRWSDVVIYQQTLYYTAVPERLENSDICAQTQEVLAQIDRVLQQHGTDKRHLLDVTIFLSDRRHVDQFNALWDSWLPPGCAPVRCAIQAQLMDSRYQLELKIIAALGDSGSDNNPTDNHCSGNH